MKAIGKTKAILIVVILIITALSAALVVEGNKRADPGPVIYKEEPFDKFALDDPIYIYNKTLYSAAFNWEKASRHSQVIAMDLEDKSLLWNHSIRHYEVTALTGSKGVIYSGDYYGNATAIDAETGEEIWSKSFHDEEAQHGEITSIYSSKDRLFTASKDGSVVAVEARTGEQIWRHTYHNEKIQSDNISVHGYDVRSVQASNGVVYSVGDGGKLVATDIETGKKKWSLSIPGTGLNTLEVVDDTIYTGSWKGNLFAIDFENKEKIWNRSIQKKGLFSIDFHKGVVYIGDKGVTAVDADNGEKIWQKRYYEEYPYFRITSVKATEGKFYGLHDEGYLLEIEKEGDLGLGIMRVLSDVFGTIWDNLGKIIIALLLGGAILGLLYGKPKKIPKNYLRND